MALSHDDSTINTVPVCIYMYVCIIIIIIIIIISGKEYF